MSSQRALWNSPVGIAYTDAFLLSPADVDNLWLPLIGRGRAELLADYVKGFRRDLRILEVGCNAGNMLNILAGMGFGNLYGLDFQQHAVKLAHQGRPGLNIVCGTALDLPFRDLFFDLVFTSGCLMHIPAAELNMSMSEICRVSRQYVMGYEYWAEKRTEIPWLGNRRLGSNEPIGNAMWKDNFRGIYERDFHLKRVRSDTFCYLDDPKKQDEMFLLEKA